MAVLNVRIWVWCTFYKSITILIKGNQKDTTGGGGGTIKEIIMNTQKWEANPYT